MFILMSVFVGGKRAVPIGPEFFKGSSTCLKPGEVIVSIHLPFSKEV